MKTERLQSAPAGMFLALRRSIRVLPTMALLAASAGMGVAQARPDPHPETRPTMPLSLHRAVEMAMQHNRRLRLAQLAVAESREKQADTRSSYFPHLSNESTALYLTDIEGIVVPAGAFGHSPATGLIPGETLRIGQGAQSAFTSGTGLAQPLTQLFKIHESNRASAADTRIAETNEMDAENSLSLQVHRLYFEILTSQAHLQAAEAALSSAEMAEAESKRAVSEGRALEVAALQAHAAALDRRQSVLKGRLAINDLMLQFDDVLGLPLGTKLQLDENEIGDPPPLPSRSDALSAAVANNPDVLVAREKLEKARASLAAARDAYIPNITGLARYSYQSGVPFLVHNFGSFGGAVTYDLFDGGSREAKLKQARIQLEMAQAALTQAESDIQIQISAAYDKVEELTDLVSVAQEAYTARKEAARVGEQRFAQDADLASAAATDAAAAYDANASLLEARFGLLLAQENIERILGTKP